MGAAAATFASVERYGRSCLLSRTEPPAGPPPSEAGSDFPRRSTEPPAVTQRGGPHCNSSAQNQPRRKRGGPRKKHPQFVPREQCRPLIRGPRNELRLLSSHTWE